MKDGGADGRGNRPQPAPSPNPPDLDETPLTQDNVFDALSSKRSRYVLVYLRETAPRADVKDLVEAVAEWETGKSIDLVSVDHRERVATSLRHAKLPKLSMLGLIEYDENAGTVRRGPHAEQADAYLDIAVSRDEDVEL